MKPPAFQFYPDNFRDGVSDMEQNEIGAYIMLLCYQWNNGYIPKDKARMERAAFGEVSAHVLRKFKLFPDGELRNERLEYERNKQTAYRESRSINGQKGGRPKAHGKHMVLKTEPKHKAQKSSPSPSPSPSPIPDSATDSIKDVGVTPTNGDAEWLATLSGNPAYEGIEVDREFGKMKAWCDANGKLPSRRRFVNWLNRCEKPLKLNGVSARTLSAFDIKTIIQAKDSKAAAIRTRYCSDTAIDQIWSDPSKRREYFELKKEVKNLNNQLSNMA